MTAAGWIKELNLTSHVEGGAFREIYRSELLLPQKALTPEHGGDRHVMTSIYFLLQHGEFSAFHRIASDEIWHHYEGSPLCIYEIDTKSSLTIHVLGKSLTEGQSPVVVIKAGSWFGSGVEIEGGYTLCGCTVAPGFDFNDFELADRKKLSAEYPEHAALITELTR